MRLVATLPAQHDTVTEQEPTRAESSRPRSESRQRTALVAVRLLPHERDLIARSARARGVTLSEFIRASAMRTAGTAAEADAR